MKVLVRPRQAGKTHAAMEWVRGGVQIQSYPGWNRLLVVHDMQAEEVLRKQWWAEVGDWSHRVFGLNDLATANFSVFPSQGIAVVFDNLELALMNRPDAVGVIMRKFAVYGFTVTGEEWTTE